MKYIYQVIFLLLLDIKIIFGDQLAYGSDQPQEYVGCFKEDISNRVFNYVAGDYRVTELTPVQCMIACGGKFRFAALQNGIFCMCSDVLPKISSNQSNCNSICPGSVNYPIGRENSKCGGIDAVSVYSIEDRILGLKIKNVEPVIIFEPSNFNVLIKNGKNSVYSFNFGDGDGSKPMKTKEKNITHVYDKPGKYEVKLRAENNASGIVETTKLISVVGENFAVEITCPKATVLGKPIECSGSMSRGSAIEMNIDYGDGMVEHLFLNGKYSHVGRKIPSLKALKKPLDLHPATFVILSSKFKKMQTVSSFEVDVSVPGNIRFQIFRPICTSEEVYCNKRHLCIAKSSNCSQVDENECLSNEIYCFHCGKCVAYSNDFMMTCQEHRQFNFSNAPSDFQLVYQYEVKIPYKGHHLIKLKPDNMFNTTPGDVIGWSCDGATTSGQIAFADVIDNKDDIAEFRFPLVTETGKKVIRSNGLKVKMDHIISVHFYEETFFTLHHVYNKTGSYSLTTNLSKPIALYVDIPISNVKLICPSLVKTNTNFTVSVPQHSGSNVTYEWFTDDAYKSIRSMTGRYNHIYQKPGVYRFTVSSSNSLNHMNDTCQIHALDAVNGLKFHHVITAVSLGKYTKIGWKVASGTNITYSVDFGDGSLPRMLFVRDSFQREASLEYRYGSIGKYIVTITANNPVGSKLLISSEAIVEIPLKNINFYTTLPHVTDNVYVAKDEHIDLYVSLAQGSNPICIFKFSESSKDQITSSLYIKHKFNKTGTFHAVVTCLNNVSSVNATLNATIVVQNIELIRDMKLKALPTVFGNVTEFTLTMKSGTLYFCNWQFGDGSMSKTDFLSNSLPILHSFKSVDDYVIIVSCYNRLGVVHSNISVSVEIPITGFQLNCSTKYIRVGQPFMARSLISTGSRITFELSWGESQKNHQTTRVVNDKISEMWHTYHKTGLYHIHAIARNNYHSIRRNCQEPIKVEYAVEGLQILTNSPIKLSSGIVEYRWYPNPGFISPTDAFISWDFGDGIKKERQVLSLKNVSNVLETHKYGSPGSFVTKITIENKVSSMTFNLKIDVQKMLPIKFNIKRKLSSTSNKTAPGFGKDNNMFPVENHVSISITRQLNDQWYVYNFGNGYKINTSLPSMVYLFPKIGTFNVSVKVYNKLQQSLHWKLISLEESVKNFNVNLTSQLTLGEKAKISINAEKYGTNVCLILSFGDLNITVFNNTECVNFKKYPVNNYEYSKLPVGEFTVYHKYTIKGNYNIILQAVNHVSFEEKTTLLKVVDPPCALPIVKINGGGSQLQPLKSKKSEMIFLTANITADCKEATFIILTWEIFKINSDMHHVLFNKTSRKTTMPFKQRPGTLDLSVYEITSKFMSVGLNTVKLTVSYENGPVMLKNIQQSSTAWFDVQATPLKASIKGGFRRTVASNINLKLDASDSYDPDSFNNDKTDLFFMWYCRRQDEAFQHNYNPKNNTSGCFEKGHHNLSRPSAQQMSIEINTGKLIAHHSYVVRLVISKDTRTSYFDQEIKVLSGNPPTMDIKCKMNCLSKLNSAQRFILESICTDCQTESILSFQWSLYKIISLKSEIKINEFSSNTTTGINQANVVIKENSLFIGNDYSLKISAWNHHATIHEAGSTEYRFKVNRPPTGGTCKILPENGYALVTKFKVICNNWVDDDMPLQYVIDVLRDENIANIYRGFESSVETVLPMGTAKSNYEMQLFVKIFDSYGDFATVSIKVKVEEPVSIDLNAVSKDLAKLSSTGNIQTLTQQAVAAGSVMNRKDDINRTSAFSKNEATMARTTILTAVSKVKACSIDQIRQVGDVYNEMMTKPEELSDDAQDASSSGMSDMSDCMLNSNPQDPSLKLAALTMLQGSSKLLHANMLKSDNSTNTNGTLNNTAATNATSKILDTVVKVGGALMRQLVAGDKPTVVKLANMNLEMSQVGEDANDAATGFQLPSLKSLIGNQTSDGAKQSVGAMVSSMSNNPYGEDKTSADIKSNIMGLSLTDKNGNSINVAGQELQMFVSRDGNKKSFAEMNSFDESTSMRFHKFNYSSLENAVVFQVKPLDKKLKIRVLLSYGRRPSLTSYFKNHTFMSNEEASKIIDKLPDPFTFVITNGELNKTGEYFIGLLVLNNKDIYSKFGYIPSLNYSLLIFETKCKVWNDDLNIWSSSGCKVGAKTTYNSTQCICKIADESSDVIPVKPSSGNAQMQQVSQPFQYKRRRVVKRVSFAGGFFVAPNPIDFDKAFAGFSNLAENPVAFSTVLAMFGVYLIMLFWARREDRKDILKAGVATLPDNDISDKQFYEISVFTGFGNSAGTTSNVFIQLSGEDGSSEPRQLCDPNKVTFKKRSQDVFLVSCEDFLGDLTYLKIWHDNSGKKPSWYMSKVAIHDLNTNKKYLFINESWLAVEEGDGSIEKVLSVASPEEIASFNHLFYSTTQKNLTDSHLWFSVFIRPPKSRFTRVQRLSCCLTLIYCTMLTNAMFYQVGGESSPSSTLKIGPFEFSAAQIGIGVMSSLIIFPVNLLIVGVFRNVDVKPTNEELSKKKAKKLWWLYELFFCCEKKATTSEFMDIITTIPDSETDLKMKASSKPKYEAISDGQIESADIGLKLDYDDKMRSQLKEEKKKKKRKLPWWMKYFAWIILILTSFTSAFFVVLYGFTFGKDKSAQWISSMLISFVQDVFVSQPIKILFLGLFVALIVKKPTEEEEEDNKKRKDEVYVNEQSVNTTSRRAAGIIKFEPPSKEKIKAARDLRLKEIKMYGIVKDIFIYLIFVTALCTVSYTHLDPRSYQFKKGLEDTFVSATYGGDISFSDINSREDYWKWLNETVVNGLFSTRWYNNKPNIKGFTQDLYSNLFGGARIRQLRVKKNTCKVAKEITSITTECNDFYSWSNEDTNDYSTSWKPVQNSSKISTSSWTYFTSAELNTYPFAGHMALYGGGGYIGDLGKYPAKSYKLINELKKQNWFDQRTRAIFFEACVYNAQVNLFAIMNFVTEFLPTNSIVVFHSVKIARLYTFGGSTQSFIIACQFFVLFFLLLFVYRESKKIYKERKKYFHDFWNWTEFVMIVLVIITLSVFFTRMLLVNSVVKAIHDNPGKFVSFNKVAKWDDLFQYMMSFLVLVACIKSIRLLSFNKTISLLASTLKGSAKPLAAFSIVFFIFFFAYVTFSFIIFVEQLEDFRSFVTSMESTMALLLGSFEFDDIKNAQRILGPIYFLSLMLFGVMYMLNVFLSIVMDTYAEVKGNIAKQSNEYEIVDFMIGRFKRFIGIQPGKPHDEKDNNLQNELNEKSLISNKRNGQRRKEDCSDEEILMKFKKMNQSLNGFYKDDNAEDNIINGIIKQRYNVNASGMRKEMNHDQSMHESEYEQELYEELHKWK